MVQAKFCFQTVTATRVAFSIIFNQGTEFTLLRIWIDMKVIGRKEIEKERGNLSWLMVNLMMENGQITKRLEKENKSTKTDRSM